MRTRVNRILFGVTLHSYQQIVRNFLLPTVPPCLKQRYCNFEMRAANIEWSLNFLQWQDSKFQTLNFSDSWDAWLGLYQFLGPWALHFGRFVLVLGKINYTGGAA